VAKTKATKAKFSKLTFSEMGGTIQAEIGMFVAFMAGGKSVISVKYGRLFAAAPEMLEALKLAYDLFAKDHALSRFNWGASGLRAEDIRELNETPGKILAAIRKAEGELDD